VLSPKCIDFIDGDESIWEQEPLERLANEGQLNAYRHTGFWKPCDTLRDKIQLQEMWENGEAKWARVEEPHQGI